MSFSVFLYFYSFLSFLSLSFFFFFLCIIKWGKKHRLYWISKCVETDDSPFVLSCCHRRLIHVCILNGMGYKMSLPELGLVFVFRAGKRRIVQTLSILCYCEDSGGHMMSGIPWRIICESKVIICSGEWRYDWSRICKKCKETILYFTSFRVSGNLLEIMLTSINNFPVLERLDKWGLCTSIVGLAPHI